MIATGHGEPLAAWFSVSSAGLAPVALPVLGLLVVLLLDALAPARWRAGRALRRAQDGVSLLALLGAGAAVVGLWRSPDLVAGGAVQAVCSWSAGSGQADPQCSFVVSELTLTLQALIVGAAVVSLLLALDGTGARDRVAHHVLFLAAVTGALALAGARDLVSLMVALELASLPAVGLVGLRRDAPGAQGALTFLYTAIVSLGLLALGAGMLLLATGSLYLRDISLALADAALPGPVRAVAALGVLLAVAGVGYKVSLAPFHLWTPDTYAGAPLPVAAFLSVVSKAAGLAAIVVLLGVGLWPVAAVWAPVVGALAVVTMTVGNVVALRQHVAVRLLAWSTVAQAGWVVLPLASLGDADSVAASAGRVGPVLAEPRGAVAASVGYLVAYVAAGLAAFAVVVVLARHVPAAEEHTLESYRGLARREPVAAAVLGFALLCLAGLPPGVMGLVGKLIALRPLVDGGAWVVAVAAALNVALGVAYYLRWTALLVATPRPVVGGPAVSDGAAGVPTWRVRPAEGLAIGAGALACVLLSVAPQLIAGLLPNGLL
ncbi:MAG: NADH-quinone oxidoreductase subunit N [Kineosporiaceae bacterium]|nr:NADH-quinone oxidoreductase subunit N [Kineosporiaceae bacterium]